MRRNKNIVEWASEVVSEQYDLHQDGEISKPARDQAIQAITDLMHCLDLHDEFEKKVIRVD